MKNQLLLFGLIFNFQFLVVNCFAQSQFQTAIGAASQDRGRSIVKTTEGGYVIAGCAKFSTGADVYVVKLSSTGALQWTRTIAGATDEFSHSIVQTTDGGYVIAGITLSFGAGNWDVYVVKLDAAGTVQWTRTIGGTVGDEGWSIVQSSDGGYAIAGTTGSFGAGNVDVYVVKLDAVGTVQWTRTIGGTGPDFGHSLVQSSDGGYAIAGYTGSFGAGDWDVYVVKLDATGALQWTRTIGGAGGDFGHSLVKSSDGGYAIAGITRSFGAGVEDVYVVKLSSTGIVQWTRSIGGTGNDEGYSIVQSSDGGYAITGQTWSFGAGLQDVYAMKLDAAGTVQWTRTIGGVGDDRGRSLVQSTDGGYAIAGHTNSFGTGGDVYVVKLDASGNTCANQGTGGISGSGGTSGSGGISGSGGTFGSGGVSGSGGVMTVICPVTAIAELADFENVLRLYPNPNSGLFNIQFSDDHELPTSISIQNILGQVILNLDVNLHSTQVDLNDAPKGIYMVLINYKEYTVTQKIIKE